MCDSIHLKFYTHCYPCKTSARKHLVQTLSLRQNIHELNNTFTVPTQIQVLWSVALSLGKLLPTFLKPAMPLSSWLNSARSQSSLTVWPEVLWSLKMSESTHPITHSHIPKNWIFSNTTVKASHLVFTASSILQWNIRMHQECNKMWLGSIQIQD
jgi:hypothetical protein